ncbi:MAG: beta-N-acetylhexosaminidase, partial [Bacteroidales bacterium]|nr:beta-N-acetylhexosaminidase [Bacteroidales bacterium]
MRAILILIIVTISLFFSVPQGKAAAPQGDAMIYQSIDTIWVDSVMTSLSLEQKIAQLFSIRAYSNKDKKHTKQIASLIRKYNIGGLTFFQGGPVRQAQLTNYYQEISQTPLLIMQDAEWGLGMRLDSTYSFPYQLTMGAMDNDSLVYAAASEIACQLKRIGVHVNLAPVIDINNNPLNPVINYRSFGENKYNVTSKGLAYMHGLQDHGIIATAKHFPGHGDTDADSHQTLPVIQHTKERLDSIELFPFNKLISEGLYGIMIAHLYLPAYDDDKNLPSTLSGNLVTGLLKEQLAFNGIIITDALDMKGVTMYYSPGEIEEKAFEAGNDILLLPGDVPKAIKKIKQAIKKG